MQMAKCPFTEAELELFEHLRTETLLPQARSDKAVRLIRR